MACPPLKSPKAIFAVGALGAHFGTLATVAYLAGAAHGQTPAAKPAPHALATSWSSGSPKIGEGEQSFKINGRVQYDVFGITTDGALAVDQDYTRSFARRAFLGVEGQFEDAWRYNIKFAFQPGADQATSTVNTLRLCQDATDAVAQRSACLGGETDRGPIVTSVATSGADSEVGFDDAYIQYVVGAWEFTLGQNNQVSPLEERTSSLNSPFNERSAMINAFGFAKTMGLAVNTSGANWSAGVGVYGDDLNNPESTSTSETVALQARGTWALILEKTSKGMDIVHLGASARYRDNSGGPDASGLRGPGFRYRARPNSGYGDRLVDTGTTAFSQDTFAGAEFAAQHNEFAVTAEVGRLWARPQDSSLDSSSFTGGYVDFFWSPTGETRHYKVKDGMFGRTTPLSTLGDDGGFGALMLGVRYDYLDLTDGAIDGGGQQGFTVQSTWQPLAFLKFQADYSRLDIERPQSPLSGTADVFTLRSQIEW